MFEKIVVISRETRMQELIARFNTKAQAAFYIKHSGANFNEYQEEDDAYQRSLETIHTQIDIGLQIQFVDRKYISNFIFTEKDIVLVVGQDGLLANVAKYATGLPIIGVNPDTSRIDGVLLSSSPNKVRSDLHCVLNNTAEYSAVTLAEARLNDGQKLLAFNDLFIGAKTHISARYRIRYQSESENQSSSGIIVSTGAGSTGWLSSLFNMASGLTEFAGGSRISPIKLAWNSSNLIFVVREPFFSRHSESNIVSGFISQSNSLTIESSMPSEGTIFSDGIESDFINFNSGSIVSISPADQKALVFRGPANQHTQRINEPQKQLRQAR